MKIADTISTFTKGTLHIYTFDAGQGTGFPGREAGTLTTWRDSANDFMS
ncbi:hypothetical protein [Bacillus paramycoides]